MAATTQMEQKLLSSEPTEQRVDKRPCKNNRQPSASTRHLRQTNRRSDVYSLIWCHCAWSAPTPYENHASSWQQLRKWNKSCYHEGQQSNVLPGGRAKTNRQPSASTRHLRQTSRGPNVCSLNWCHAPGALQHLLRTITHHGSNFETRAVIMRANGATCCQAAVQKQPLTQRVDKASATNKSRVQTCTA